MSSHNTKKESGANDDDVFFSFKTLRPEEEEAGKQSEERADEVINIYHQNMPKKLTRKTGGGFKIFLIGLVVLIVASSVFYYYGRNFFNAGQFFAGNNVELEITGLTEAAAGEEISYIIKYQNLEKIDLTNVVLTANYPTGFVYKKAKPLPTNANNDSWELGYLRSGRSGQVEIFGALIGDQDRSEKIRAKLKYNLGNDKSIGNQEAEIETVISSSILTLDVSAPAQLGEEVEYIIKYSNNSLTPIEDIKIIVTYPEDFIFSESEPLAPQENSGDSVWLITQLADKENKELKIKGKFAIKEEEDEPVEVDKEKVIKVQIGLLDAQDVFYPQQEKELITLISSGDIVVNVELNSSAENSIIELGDTLIYLVSYSNQSEMDLAAVKLKLIINSNIVDWTSLENQEEGLVTDEEIINGMLARAITWNIEEIKTGNEGNYIVKIKTKPYSQLDKTRSLDLKTEARVRAVIGEINQEKVNKTIAGNKITAQVNTELKLQTQVTIQNDKEYQLSWQLTNSIHEVEEVKVEAGLSDTSSWLNDMSVTVGDIYFDVDNKTISWQINRIPVGVDIPLAAKFKLNTTAEGRPKLLVDLKLSAIDKVTGASIEQSFSEVMGY